MPEDVTAFLFERPLRLLLVAGGVQFLLIGLWSRRRTRGFARAAQIGLAVLPVLMGASALVVTDREAVLAVCDELASAVERGDLPAIADRLDEGFRAGDWDREAFLDVIRRATRAYRIYAVRVTATEFRRSSENAMVADVTATCGVRGEDMDVDRVPSAWRLSFRAAPSGWRVLAIEPLPTPFSPIRSWRDVSR